MDLGAIVQVRMSSQRFPGKVLHPVEGRPVLGYLLDRLKSCPGLETVIVATSLEPGDDPVARFCGDEGFPCVRGPLEDVAGRFVRVLEEYPLEGFLRVCGDSPWLDPGLVKRGLDLFGEGGFDLVTNVFPRSFPPGLSVEVVRSRAFQRAYAAMTDPAEREHVTKRFYAHPGEYRIRNFSAAESYGGLSLALDTEADMAAFKAAVSSLDRPQAEYGWQEVAELYLGLPERGRTG